LEDEQQIAQRWWGIEEIRLEIKNFLQFNENESTANQNLWDTAKAG
jgi:hypothetical protein